MKNYDFNFIDFLSGRNTILVENEKEFNQFKKILMKLNMGQCLGKYRTFNDWQELAIINRRNSNVFLFEFDNLKGLTWSDNIEKSEEWYRCKPFKVNDVYLELFGTDVLGANFVITGTLSNTRDYYQDIIEKYGGNIANTVTKKTNYLIVGDNAGNKLKKAENLIADGCNIKIIYGDSEFYEFFKNMLHE